MEQLKVHENNPVRSEYVSPSIFGSSVRALTLALAILTTGLTAGLYFDWSVSITAGLGDLPDASYIAATSAITERIGNPLFLATFLGPILFLPAALVLHLRRPRTARFWLIAAATVLYFVGSFLLTMLVNAPMSYGLTEIAPDAPAQVLAEARNAYEGTWNFWHGVRTLFTTLAFVALIGACLLPAAHAPQRGSRVR